MSHINFDLTPKQSAASWVSSCWYAGRHFSEALNPKTSVRGRVYHALAGAIDLIPIIGRIASLVEKNAFSKLHATSMPTPSESSSNSLDLSGVRLQKKKDSGIEKNYFFQSDLFKSISAKCKNETEYTFVLGLCYRLLSLIKESKDEPMVYQTLQQLNFTEILQNTQVSKGFTSLSEETLNALADLEISLGISILETIKGKKFSDDNIEDASELAFAFMDRIDMYYHGTNLHSVKQIKKEGLQRKNHAFEKDIAEIDKIAARILEGESMFGWYEGQFVADKNDPNQKQGAVFVTARPLTAISYAIGSPEWFQSFIQKFKPYGQKHPFLIESRDYDKAKQMLESWLTQYEAQLEQGEPEKFRSFFNKYWSLYAKPTGIILSMRNDFFTNENFEKYISSVKYRVCSDRETAEKERNRSMARDEIDFNNIMAHRDKLEAEARELPLSCDILRKAMHLRLSILDNAIDVRIGDKDITPGELKYYKYPLVARSSPFNCRF